MKILNECKINKENAFTIKEIDDLKEKISIVSDTMFKTMLLNTKRKKYACKLLEYIFDVSYEEIYNNLYSREEVLDKNYYNNKTELADYVLIVNDVAINIVLNCNNSTERNIDYRDKLCSSNFYIGDKEYPFAKTIHVALNNFCYEGREEITKEIFGLKNEKGEWLTFKKQYIYFYIPAIKMLYCNKGIEALEDVERYILVLAEEDILKATNLGLGDKIMEEYIKESQEVVEEIEFQSAYNHELDKYKDGEDHGRMEGIKIGALNKQQEIAKTMLQDNISLGQIAKFTGLSLEEVEQLKASKN